MCDAVGAGDDQLAGQLIHPRVEDLVLWQAAIPIAHAR